MRRLTYSWALTSPASKWVFPFCSGTCFATFSLWKLKNTNLPRNSDSPVLRLITTGALSSALTAPDLLGAAAAAEEEEEALVALLARGLRPWKEMLAGERPPAWRLEVAPAARDKTAGEAAAIVGAEVAVEAVEGGEVGVEGIGWI